MDDPFWFDEPGILWRRDRLIEFVPTADMSMAERYNAIARLSGYVSIVLYLWSSRSSWLWLLPVTLLVTYVLQRHHPLTLIQEDFEREVDRHPEIHIDTQPQLCQRPTAENPFMNVLITDYTARPHRPPACQTEDPAIGEQVEQHFSNNLYKDVDDVFNRGNSQRQFYTNPSTTIPNDRETWMNWCWKTTNVCRDGDQEACYRYHDVRAHGKI